MFQEVTVQYDKNSNYKFISRHALGIQTCLFPVEGRLRDAPYLRGADERPCGEWVRCVAPVLFGDHN